jgi:TolA-binding protein
VLAAIAALVLFPATASLSQQDEAPLREKGSLPPLNPLANPKPDANRFMEYEMQRKQMQKRVEELNVLRQKEMKEDTAQLVKLAAEVKIETNTARIDALSAAELRKVETIEKLAHGVREKMKTTVN